MSRKYPSSEMLGIATEIARREIHCRLRCNMPGCGRACYWSGKAYLERLPLIQQVEYNAYMRAKPMIDAATA